MSAYCNYENEWKRTNPDLVVYKPGSIDGDDAINQHLLVSPTPNRRFAVQLDDQQGHHDFSLLGRGCQLASFLVVGRRR